MFFAHPSSSHLSSSRPSSRPASRPASPTRTNTRTSVNSAPSGAGGGVAAGTGGGSGAAGSRLASQHASYPSQSQSHPHPTVDTSDLDAFLEPSAPSTASSLASPAYGPYTPSSEMGFSSHLSSGANTPGGYYFSGPTYHQPLEIVLDSEHLVMRGAGGDMNPAYLSGRIELDLTESTNIREISMVLTGKAKVHFTDAIA